MAEKELKENADKLQKLYLQNLALKLREGKALSEREFEHLRLLSKQSLSRFRLRISQHLKIPGTRKTMMKTLTKSVSRNVSALSGHILSLNVLLKPERKMQRRAPGRKPRKGKKACAKNAWKHGQFARDFILYRIKPCKSTCPHYPCDLVKDNATQPGGECLDKAAVIQFFSAICEAAKNKQYDDFNELAALTIANQINILHTLMGRYPARWHNAKEGKVRQRRRISWL